MGAGLAYWFVPLFPHLPISALAMLCMAAYFSGVVQSPITAAVIVLEVTNNIEMTVGVGGLRARHDCLTTHGLPEADLCRDGGAIHRRRRATLKVGPGRPTQPSPLRRNRERDRTCQWTCSS